MPSMRGGRVSKLVHDTGTGVYWRQFGPNGALECTLCESRLVIQSMWRYLPRADRFPLANLMGELEIMNDAT